MNLISTTMAAVMVLALAAPLSFAGTDMIDAKDMKGVTPPECSATKDWSIELGSGVMWSNVRTDEPASYRIVPIDLTAALAVDDVSLDHFLGGIFRGYTEFQFRGQYMDITKGPENRFAGLLVGPRYNFVQPGWKIIPFVEGTVGIGFADSRPQLNGLGQDFNFTFGVGAGVKYQLSCDWYLRLAAEYQHISNAGLSEPGAANHPVDALGPVLSVGYSF
jgi:opacity protein-like surface antigen